MSSNDERNEERFVRLEIKAAYLEKTVLDLEEIVIAQGNLVKDLQRRIEQFERQLQGSDEREFPHEKPPHY